MNGHTIEVRDDTARITFKKGQVTLEVWRNAFDALLSDPRFRPGMICLWDGREASHGSLSLHGRETMALITAQRRLERGDGLTRLWLRATWTSALPVPTS